MDLSKVGVRLLVKDTAACFDFYTQVMGYQVLFGKRGDVYNSFTVDGSTPCLAIFKKENNFDYEGYQDLGDHLKSDFATYNFQCDDINADYEALKQKGVEFIGEPRDMPDWGMRCVWFRDPEGNLLELSGALQE